MKKSLNKKCQWVGHVPWKFYEEHSGSWLKNLKITAVDYPNNLCKMARVDGWKNYHNNLLVDWTQVIDG